jgi:SAM-dependent methyltransferase
MAVIKEFIKKSLHTLHLYEPVQQAWSHRPDLKTSIWNSGYRIYGTGDHIPIPPAYLIHYTVNSPEIAWFLHTGLISYKSLEDALKKNHYSLDSFHNVLDFGCGCGRVLRYWRHPDQVHVYGSDYNPALIRWDKAHLSRIASFGTNHLAPPLDYGADFFDFIYALSVFTHLPLDLQIAWMDDLYRVLQPGGVLLITLHGKWRILDLDEEKQKKFNQGEMVVIHEEDPGSNICGSYHPFEFVVKHLVGKFELVDFIESGARDSNQDIYILRKPGPTQ